MEYMPGFDDVFQKKNQHSQDINQMLQPQYNEYNIQEEYDQ